MMGLRSRADYPSSAAVRSQHRVDANSARALAGRLLTLRLLHIGPRCMLWLGTSGAAELGVAHVCKFPDYRLRAFWRPRAQLELGCARVDPPALARRLLDAPSPGGLPDSAHAAATAPRGVGASCSAVYGRGKRRCLPHR